jgi:photosystem II stability/assembly factor-like uncharacterized protein
MKKIVQCAAFMLLLTPAFGQWSDQNSGISNDLEDVFFINQQEGWAVGRQGKIIHTTNAGATWTQQNSGTTSDLNKVHMVGANFGLAVGDDGAAVRYNGTSWSATSSGTSQDLYSVFFIDANTGWIGGDWAIIKKTTNGGTSFSAESTSSMSNTFSDIHMFSATDGWAVGSTGAVWRYNGSNWVTQTTPESGGTGSQLHAISFSSPTNGFFSGDDSKIYRWDGSSWTQYSTSLPDNSFHIYDVQVLSENLAYAVTTPGFGGEGFILKFDGNTWNTDYEYTGMNSELFSGVSFPAANKGYAVGAGGMIKTKGTAAAGIDENAELMALNAYPNPFAGEVTIGYTLREGNDVAITVSDISGKTLSTELLAHQGAGQHEFQFDGSALGNGIYYVKVVSGNSAATVRIVK